MSNSSPELRTRLLWSQRSQTCHFSNWTWDMVKSLKLKVLDELEFMISSLPSWTRVHMKQWAFNMKRFSKPQTYLLNLRFASPEKIFKELSNLWTRAWRSKLEPAPGGKKFFKWDFLKPETCFMNLRFASKMKSSESSPKWVNSSSQAWTRVHALTES